MARDRYYTITNNGGKILFCEDNITNLSAAELFEYMHRAEPDIKSFVLYWWTKEEVRNLFAKQKSKRSK